MNTSKMALVISILNRKCLLIWSLVSSPFNPSLDVLVVDSITPALPRLSIFVGKTLWEHPQNVMERQQIP